MALTQTEVSQLYVSIFGRASEGSGNTYWQQDQDSRVLTAETMLNTDAAKDYFVETLNDNQAYIEHIYENTLGKTIDDDADGIAYWVSELDGGKSKAEVTVALIDAAQDPANAGDAQDQFNNKVEVSDYVADNIEDFTDTATFAAFIDGVDETDASVIDGMAEVDGIGTSFTLTNSPDVETANVFTAGRVWNPDGSDFMNSLSDDDVLTGVGTNPTLNMTFTNDTESGDLNIMPDMTNIETVNVKFTADARQVLDLQDTSGLVNLNATRIDDLAATNVTFDNIQSVLTTASVMNSNDNTLADMIFDHQASILTGDTDEVALTLGDVQMDNLRMDGVSQGYETINLLSSTAANSLNTMTLEEVETLNITGDADLTLGASSSVFSGTLVEATHYTAGLANVAGSMNTLDATTFTGVLDVTMGGEINAFQDDTSGVLVDFALTGGTGNDFLRFADGINLEAADTVDGGAGVDEINTMLIHGSSTIAGQVANVQNLEIRSGHDVGVVADAVAINTTTTAYFADLATTVIRNEGQDFVAAAGTWRSTPEALAVTLNSYTDAQADAITYLHGTTGNNGIANNALTVDFAADAATNTVGLTLSDAPNTDPRFNLQLTSAEANGIRIADNDTDSNTLALNSFATIDNLITITGGAANDFFNLDATANGFGKVTTGATGDATTVVTARTTAAPYAGSTLLAPQISAAQISAQDTAVDSVLNTAVGGELLVTKTIDASTYVGDIIARVGQANQTITTGTGDDTIIFADRGPLSTSLTTSGLTILDTVAASTGTDTIVLDGTRAIAVGASEWTNLSGVDALRLAGVAGSTFNVQITDQFVDQTDDGSMLTIINNDGDLRTAAENVAEIDITSLSAVNGITFVGANGDGSSALMNAQTVVLDDVTANGLSVLDGGDRDIVTAYTSTNYGTQTAADNQYLANVAANQDGNDNIYEVVSSGTDAEVTVGDLSNVSNFSTIKWLNDDAVSRNLSLVLDDATITSLVDANHIASSTAVETLKVEAVDSVTVVGATADLTIQANTVTSAYDMHIMASRGVDDINTGAGADVVVMAGNYAAGVYTTDTVLGGNTGYDINGRANGTAVPLVVTDNINLGGGTDEVVTYGAIDVTGTNFGEVENFTAFSDITINASDLNSFNFTFAGTQDHTLNIINDLALGVALDYSGIQLTGASDLDITTDGTATINSINTYTSSATGVITIDGAVQDTTAPLFVEESAVVNGTVLTLTYNEALNTAAAPEAGSFVVEVGGKRVNVESVEISGSDIVLTLETAVAGTDDDVKVSYNDPTSGNDILAIQDADGNDAISLTDRAVINNTIDGGGDTIDLADVVGGTYTADDEVAEIFQLDFSIVDGVANSADIVVEIIGFDETADVLRFDDAGDTPATVDEFLDAATVASDGFADETTISFFASAPATGSAITLVGITDATLGGATPFVEIV